MLVNARGSGNQTTAQNSIDHTPRQSRHTYSFAGASLGTGHEVTTSHDDGNCPLLYRCWLIVAGLGNISFEYIIEVSRCKTAHQSPVLGHQHHHIHHIILFHHKIQSCDNAIVRSLAKVNTVISQLISISKYSITRLSISAAEKEHTETQTLQMKKRNSV